MSYFPMFVELKGVSCLIVGGGRIALRKAEVLLDFGADVTLMASRIMDEIQNLSGVCCVQKDFEESDLEGRGLVVAATDDKELNHRIADACKKRRIPINAVDQAEDCSFIFPAYLKKGEVVSAFSSGGQSPVLTQYLKKEVEPLMTDHLGDLAACLGGLRDLVKHCVDTEGERKKLYRELLHLGLEKKEIPSQEEIKKILDTYTNVDRKEK